MKKYLRVIKITFLISICLLIVNKSAYSQTHHIYQSNVQNENTMYNDVINFDVFDPNFLVPQNRTFMVGRRSSNANMSQNTSAFIKCVAVGGGVIWQREINPTINNMNCEFLKLIRANNGNIIAVGYMDGGANFANSNAVIVIYDEVTGARLREGNFNTNTKLNNLGDNFLDVIQDPNNNNIYVCGSNNSAPMWSNSIVASFDFNTLAVNWYREYRITGDNNTNTDGFHTLEWYNNQLHVFGTFQGNTDYDLTYISLNANNGNVIDQRRIDFQNVRPQGASDDCVHPKELHIDRTNGSFLLSGMLGNDYIYSRSNTHFVMRGSFAAQTFTITNLNEYRNTDPTRLWENNIEIEPTNISNGDFILTQSPGSICAFNPTNLSVSGATMESHITSINNMNTQIWSREIGIDGRQWLSGSTFDPTGNNILFVGSSIQHPRQTLRDAYLFTSPTNIPITQGNCPIIGNDIDIYSMTPTINNIEFTPDDILQTTKAMTFGIPDLRPLNLCELPPCDLDFSFTFVINSDPTNPENNRGNINITTLNLSSTYRIDWGDLTHTLLPPPHLAALQHWYSAGSYLVCVTEYRADGRVCTKCIRICVPERLPDVIHGGGDPDGRTDIKKQNNNIIEPTSIEIQTKLKNEMNDKLQVYPNPTSDNTKIDFKIETATKVSIRVIDLLGKVVLNIPNQQYEAGNQTANLNTKELTSGIYTIIVSIGEKEISEKLSIVK